MPVCHSHLSLVLIKINYGKIHCNGTLTFVWNGASVALWVKRWYTDLAGLGSIPAWDRNLSKRKRSSIAHSLSLSSNHRPDMTKILLKRTYNRKSSIHPSIVWNVLQHMIFFLFVHANRVSEFVGNKCRDIFFRAEVNIWKEIILIASLMRLW